MRIHRAGRFDTVIRDMALLSPSLRGRLLATGHITKAEQRQINRQENQVSRQIHNERQAGK